MKVLLTGATGTLGRQVVKIFPPEIEVLPLSRKEIDLENVGEIFSKLSQKDTDFIVHTAAMTNVDKCELEGEKAFKINWLATKAIALFAKEKDIPLLYISTDYVFDGEKGDYYELDATNPLSIYGKSKLWGEIEIRNLLTKFYIVRTSWIYGRGGKNFMSRVKEIIEREKRVRVVRDQISCPTYAPDLAMGIKELILRKPPWGVYHLAGSEPASPFEFFEEAKEILKSKVELVPISWQQLGAPARRPKRSVLINFALYELIGLKLPSWKVSLRRFLNEKN